MTIDVGAAAPALCRSAARRASAVPFVFHHQHLYVQSSARLHLHHPRFH
jgi:hypothetical protein